MRISVIEKKEYVPYEKTVTINRAPTDKSVELLNEFEEKAIDNLIGRGLITLPDCSFNVKYYELNDCFTGNVKCILIAKINGKEYKHKFFYQNYLQTEQERVENIKNGVNALFLKITAHNLEIQKMI